MSTKIIDNKFQVNDDPNGGMRSNRGFPAFLLAMFMLILSDRAAADCETVL